MGKTLGSILTVAAAVAVNVIPGVGQFLSASIGLSATAASSVVSAVTFAGIASAAGLLGLGPSAPKPDTADTPIKTARPPRVSAYGRSRLYGAYAFYDTAPDGTAVDVYAIADGKADEIEHFYLNDDAVTVDGSGAVTEGTDGRFKSDAIHLYSTDGSAPGAGFPAITALVGGGVWGADARGDGVVAAALTAKSVKAKDFQETYPAGGVPALSVVARWQLCPDPAIAGAWQPALWSWTENPVRQLLHYKMVRAGPRPALPKSDSGYAAAEESLWAAWWAEKITPTLGLWQAAAADCDSARELAGGGTESRYRSAVAHKHTDKHQNVIAALLATFDGWIATRSDGALVVYSGRYYEPTISIGPDQIIAYTFDSGPPDEAEAVNEIGCSYISGDHDFNTVECDPWRDESDISARGQILSVPLEAQVPSHGQARALAKRLMARKQAVARGSCTTNIAGRTVIGERFVDLHLEEAGTVFYSGPVEILSARRITRGGVAFEWVAADPAVDEWDAATEEGQPAAGGNSVPREALAAPTVDSVTLTDEGNLAVTASDPDGRNDLTWRVRARATGSTAWGPEQESTAMPIGVDRVPNATQMQVQAAYTVGDGRTSPWSAAETVDLIDVIYDGGTASG